MKRPKNRWLHLLFILSLWLGVSPATIRMRYLHLVWSLLVPLGCVWSACLRQMIVKWDMEAIAIEKMLYLTEYPFNMIITGLFSLMVLRAEHFHRQYKLQLEKMLLVLLEEPVKRQDYYKQLGDYVLRLLLMIFPFHGLCAAIDVIWFGYDTWGTICSNCAHNLGGLIIGLGLVHYILSLRSLDLLYKQLIDKVEQLEPKPSSCEVFMLLPAVTEVDLKLEQLRCILMDLDDLYSHLLSRFGLVILISLVNSLLSFCYELFDVFRILQATQWDHCLLLYRLLWVLMQGLRIWAPLIGNRRLVERKCQLCLLLNGMEVWGTSLERAVNRFLLQLKVDEATPGTVCGLLDLDTLTVGGLISALSAIVIFLIQIDLGNKSLMGYTI